MFKLMFIAAVVAGFVSVDRDFRYKCNYRENRDSLLVMLEKTSAPKDKAEVYWRLSRASLMMGAAEQTKAGKRYSSSMPRCIITKLMLVRWKDTMWG